MRATFVLSTGSNGFGWTTATTPASVASLTGVPVSPYTISSAIFANCSGSGSIQYTSSSPSSVVAASAFTTHANQILIQTPSNTNLFMARWTPGATAGTATLGGPRMYFGAPTNMVVMNANGRQLLLNAVHMLVPGAIL